MIYGLLYNQKSLTIGIYNTAINKVTGNLKTTKEKAFTFIRAPLISLLIRLQMNFITLMHPCADAPDFNRESVTEGYMGYVHHKSD